MAADKQIHNLANSAVSHIYMYMHELAYSVAHPFIRHASDATDLQH